MKTNNQIIIKKRTDKDTKIFNSGYKVGRKVGYNKAIDDFVEKCKRKRYFTLDGYIILISELEQIAKELKK